MRSQFVFKFSNFLFHRFYRAYKLLYFPFKRLQDRQEIELLTRHIRKGDTIIDVGANIGFYARLFSELTGKGGKIYCFEPDTYNYKRLLQTIKNYPNIIPKNAAVSNSTGHLDFYTSPTKNVDHRAYAHDAFHTKYTVDSICLDDFPGKDTKVDVLKVDVQGFEMPVYKGAQQLLEANPGIKIFSEFWPYGLEKAGASKEEFFEFFTTRGFSIYLLKDNEQTLITKDLLKEFPVDEQEYFNVFISKQ